MLKILIFFLVLSLSSAQEVSVQEYNKLPRLFHLDDYDRCLSEERGLYCLGTFELIPNFKDATYVLLKELTKDRHRYNRTLLHRGYCVSERCPSSETNSTFHFEQCVAHSPEVGTLQLKLQKLDYCRTYYDKTVVPLPDTSQRAFLYVICVILMLNITGTAYDLYSENGKKNKLLMSWSMIANWDRLTGSYEDKDPRFKAFAPIKGTRVILTICTIMVHVNMTNVMMYLKNVEVIEQYSRGMYIAILANGTILNQMFITISCFLCAYNLLISSEKKYLRLNILPKNIIKRMIRISPVHLLVIGYAATWWIYARDGPMWHMKIGSQMENCKRKFWTHALFLNNIIDKDYYCFIQTWFRAVDMQLYIVAVILTVIFARYGYKSVYILSALFLGSCSTLSCLSYYFHWESLIYLTTSEILASTYKGIQSFHILYTSPLGNLPACLMGILLALLQYFLTKHGVNFSNYKWLVYVYTLSIPAYACWSVLGYYIRPFTTPWFTAFYVGGERLVIHISVAVHLIGIMNVESAFRRFFSSRVWDVPSRLSLPVVMVHWCLNVSLSAGRPDPIYVTYFDTFADGACTVTLAYLVAVPVSIMVELPVQKFLDTILF